MTYLVVAVVCLLTLTSAGPTLVGLAQAAVPLVIALGVVAGMLRIVWYITSRY